MTRNLFLNIKKMITAECIQDQKIAKELIMANKNNIAKLLNSCLKSPYKERWLKRSFILKNEDEMNWLLFAAIKFVDPDSVPF